MHASLLLNPPVQVKLTSHSLYIKLRLVNNLTHKSNQSTNKQYKKKRPTNLPLTKKEEEEDMNKIRSLGALSPLSGWPHRGKRCRARGRNYAKTELKQRNFSEDEDELIIKLHALLGNRWSLIAGRIPGRTDNEIRIHWETYLKRKLIKMGIDPTNHRLYHHNHYITKRYLSSSPKEHVETNVVVSDQSSSVSDSCDIITTIPISSTTNCSEGSTTSTTRIPLPDLNIGLIPMTKTVINPLPARCLQESTDSTNYASTSQETLVLFR